MFILPTWVTMIAVCTLVCGAIGALCAYERQHGDETPEEYEDVVLNVIYW